MTRFRSLVLAAFAIGFFLHGSIAFAAVTSTIGSLGQLSSDAAQADAQVAKLLGPAKNLIAAGRVTDARASLDALKTHPEISDVDVVIADLMFAMGRNVEGQQWLERASATEPQRLAIHLAFCELAVRQRRWFDGWVLARLAAKLDPPDHWSVALRDRAAKRLMLLKAVCCEGRADWTMAREAYESLLSSSPGMSDPMNRDVNVGLARSCFQLKDYDASLAALTTLVSKNRTLGTPQQLLAQFYEQSEMIPEADGAYAKSIAEADEDRRPSVRLAYAKFLLHTNAPAQAKPLLQDPITKIENAKALEDERLYLQAVLARMEGRLEQSQTILSKLHQDHPDSVSIANQLAVILVSNEDEAIRARALQIAEASVRNVSGSADGWATLGWVRLRLGDLAGADASLAQSLKLGKPSRDTLYYLSQLKRVAGKTEEADAFERYYNAAKGPKVFNLAE
ncbi:Tetratricopeptide repeat protein [Rubripirellula lacrimiformis]|uniref:Tetratricopeptide repeat protein n=1 Tax=Rubripirellula lacrimiformis TaxID=1930273 RepID=A0A517NF31_9BACT|nr:tetratricopeptide repeat protein [Rubripirellula lacrimiformis]QDT05744.1 Tetratricopeptide repeat protein [Rubripirellula lacrimiformis]